MNDLSTTIIGCGWLGKAFGEALAQKGISVYGSVRNESGFSSLTQLGIQPFELDLKESVSVPQEICESTQNLVITLPPLHRDEPMRYHEKLVALLGQFSDDVHVIFTSSTGIYPDQEGVYDESFIFPSDQDSSILNVAENAIRENVTSHVILRLGGLIGPNRHPIRFLQGRSEVKNPWGIINFVHQGDCVRAMLSMIENKETTGTFNLVFPNYPQRKNYYTSAAHHYDLPAPTFSDEAPNKRIISSQKITQQLDFEFKFPIDHFPELQFD